MRFLFYAAFICMAFVPSTGMSFDRQDIPDVLQSWVPWVLDGHEQKTCPRSYDGQHQSCRYLNKLTLDLGKSGGRFSLQAETTAAGWVPLPGSRKHWPQQVKTPQGQILPVSWQQNAPSVYVKAGTHNISGKFSWASLPYQLALPRELALTQLKVNQKNIPHPDRRTDGRLWLRNDQPENTRLGAVQPEDSLKIQVYRKISDNIPARITTMLKLTVSGRQREETFPSPLLDNVNLMQLESTIPAQLAEDGKLYVDVQPGTWWITLTTRLLSPLEHLEHKKFPWGEELWSFEPFHHFRSVDVQGGNPVDPVQAEIPPQWHHLAAYRVLPEEKLFFEVKRGGEAQLSENKIHLHRTAWFALDGKGATVQDQLKGYLQKDWQLVQNSADLQRVESHGQLRSVNLYEENQRGVELRQQNANVQAVSTLDQSVPVLGVFSIPASGWQADLASLDVTLNIPPAWRIIGIAGDVDHVWGSWLSLWSLYDVFLLLLVSLAVTKVWGWRWGAFTVVGMGLIFHDSLGLKSILLVAIAIAALLPVLSKGRLQRWVRTLRLFTLISFIGIALPFVVSHLRTAVYPHLEKASLIYPKSYQHRNREIAQQPAFVGTMNDADMARDGLYETEAFNQPKKMAAMRSLSSSLEEKVARRDKIKLNQQKNSWAIDKMLPTGVGIPAWRWHQVRLKWDGPVAQGEKIHVWVMRDIFFRIFEVLKVIFLLILGARVMLNTLPSWPDIRSFNWKKMKQYFALVVLGILLSSPLQAGEIPPRDVLDQLRQKLLERPECLPNCAVLSNAALQVNGNDVSMTLHYDVVEDVAVALPQFGRPWQPDVVLIGKDQSPILSRQVDKLLLLLPAGRQSVTLRGTMPEQADVFLSMPLAPMLFTHKIKGWHIQGLSDNGKVQRGVRLIKQLKRQTATAAKEKTKRSTSIPPYVQITRTLYLEKDWQIHTRVQLISGNGLQVAFPLLEKEQVTQSGIEVKDGKVILPLTTYRRSFDFVSIIEPQKELTFQSATEKSWHEIWQVVPGYLWRVEFEGLTPIYHSQNNHWQPLWRPHPGQELKLKFTQPKTMSGQATTIHKASLTMKPGKRIQENTLQMDIETSHPHLHTVGLPMDVTLTAVHLGGRKLSLPKISEGKIDLPLNSGRQQVQLDWRNTPETPSFLTTPSVDLGVPASNVHVYAKLPGERWAAWSHGSWGPAIMIWSLLAAYAVIAFILGRVKFVPLKSWQWFLLSIGFSQMHPLSLVIPFGWLMALGVKKSFAGNLSGWRFNLGQVALVLLGICSITIIFVAVEQGLLGGAQMYVSGGSSYAQQLHWYIDATEGGLPDIFAITPPTWLYRVIMMAWSFWLAYTLVDLMKWVWACFAEGGYWQSRKKK